MDIDVIETLCTYIDSEFEFIGNLEKKYGTSAKKIFNATRSNCDILLYELLQFLLSIIENEQTNEMQCGLFSLILKTNITVDVLESLKQSIDHDIPFYSLQLFIIADKDTNKTFYNGVTQGLFKLFENLGNLMINFTNNKSESTKIKDIYLNQMSEIITNNFNINFV